MEIQVGDFAAFVTPEYEVVTRFIIASNCLEAVTLDAL